MHHRNVEFQKIRIQNFLSYGNDPIEVEFKNGITFVTGYNKDEDDTNGVGKTSLIVDSLSFLIFGETYRKINLNLIPNKRTRGTCFVEGWLKVNGKQYHITRSIGPSRLILEIDGEWEKYTKSISETTKDIIAALGISKTVFTNTVVMTNKDSLSFLNQGKDPKVKFIEGILGLEAFAEFFKKAKDEYKTIADERGKVEFQVNQLVKTLESDNQYLNQAEEKNKKDIQQLEQRIQDCQDIQPIDNSTKIDELNNQKEELRASVQAKDGKIGIAQSKRYELKFTLDEFQKKLNDFDNIKLECPTCKRPFDEHNPKVLDEEKQILKTTITEKRDFINKLDKGIEAVKKEKDVLQKKYSETVDSINTLTKEQLKFSESQREIDKLNGQLDSVRDFQNPFMNKVSETSEQLKNKQTELLKWNKDVRLADIVKQMASPTGIKSLMVKKVIESFNERINQYMVRLNSPYRVHFDEYFEETITHKDGEAFSYGSLSGGEAKRVDFSMLFAFRDIRRLQSNISVNLTVMDELFDSALSEKGMFNIIELLKESSDECYFIVTHRKENVDESGCDVIHLIKENGITRIENKNNE
jgi:DNA repair exonuclease SbcCD ATPase subunit